jgi:hypothetical protein
MIVSKHPVKHPIVYDSVLREFSELSREEILEILCQYYIIDASQNQLRILLQRDAKRDFSNMSEMICRIVRKHLGRPEIPGLKLYPEDQIDEEINRLIQDMISRRSDVVNNLKSEKWVRKRILQRMLKLPVGIKLKDIEKEIEKRYKSTGMSKENMKRKIYMTYFNIGIEETTQDIIGRLQNY